MAGTKNNKSKVISMFVCYACKIVFIDSLHSQMWGMYISGCIWRKENESSISMLRVTLFNCDGAHKSSISILVYGCLLWDSSETCLNIYAYKIGFYDALHAEI